jgi:hypothetical protein
MIHFHLIFAGFMLYIFPPGAAGDRRFLDPFEDTESYLESFSHLMVALN